MFLETVYRADVKNIENMCNTQNRYFKFEIGLNSIMYDIDKLFCKRATAVFS